MKIVNAIGEYLLRSISNFWFMRMKGLQQTLLMGDLKNDNHGLKKAG